MNLHHHMTDKDKDSLFQKTEGTYKGLKIGIPNGEDLEFFEKYL